MSVDRQSIKCIVKKIFLTISVLKILCTYPIPSVHSTVYVSPKQRLCPDKMDSKSMLTALLLNCRLRLMNIQRRRLMLKRLMRTSVLPRRRMPRRWYIRPVNVNRGDIGEFVRRAKTFSEDSEYYEEYYRMSAPVFKVLLDLVSPFISHQPTHFQPISPEERLVITLR